MMNTTMSKVFVGGLLLLVVTFIPFQLYRSIETPPAGHSDYKAMATQGETAGRAAGHDFQRTKAVEVPEQNQRLLAAQVAKNKGITGKDARAFEDGYVKGYQAAWRSAAN